MATIGLDKLYYAKITEGDNGEESYGTPTQLAKAMTAELSVELAEATLYADDGAAEVVKEFQSGTLTLGVDDIGVQAAQDLTGAKIDDNKVLISTSEDQRQIPLLLAVQGQVRHSRDQPHHQGREHRVLHTHHRGHGSSPQQAGRSGQASVESGGIRGFHRRICIGHQQLVRRSV